MIRVAAIAFLCISSAIVLYASPGARLARAENAARVKVENFHRDGRVHLEAIEELFGWDCSGMNHEADNAYPRKVSELYEYVEAPLADPFGSAGESVRFIQQHRSGNGARFVFVSRGPDGDWDMDRLTHRVQFYPMVLPGEFGTRTDYATGETIPFPEGTYNYSASDDPYVTSTIEAGINPILQESPRRVVLERVTAVILPGRPNDRPRLTYDLMLSEWRRDGVSVYDPTNGVLSDGDLLLVDPWLLKTY